MTRPWLLGISGGLGDSVIVEPLLRKFITAAGDSRVVVACNALVVPLFNNFQGVSKAIVSENTNHTEEILEEWEWVIDLASIPTSAWMQKLNTQHLACRNKNSTAHFSVDGEIFEHRTFKKHLNGLEGSPNLPAWMVEAPILAACLKQSHWDWLGEGLFPQMSFKIDPRRMFPNDDRAFILLIPCGTGTHRRWPSSHWVSLGARFRKAGYDIKIILGPEEIDLIDELCEIEGEFLCSPPLLQIAALSLQADFCVAHDCGPMHLAAACQGRLLTIFGPTNPKCWFPYDPTHANHIQKLSADICPWGELNHLVGKHWTHWPSVTEVWHACKFAPLEKLNIT